MRAVRLQSYWLSLNILPCSKETELTVLAGFFPAQKEVKLNSMTQLRDCVTCTVPGNKIK